MDYGTGVIVAAVALDAEQERGRASRRPARRGGALQERGKGTDTPRDMALADWLLPLLLLASEHEDGHAAFDWALLDSAPALPPPPDAHPV